MSKVVAKYIEMPKRNIKDFWTNDKINHIRKLSNSPEASEIFIKNDDSLRILDRIDFNINRFAYIPEAGATTESSLAGYDLSIPVYLGDMSYGALSGNPNIAIARTAEITRTMAGTGEGGLYGSVADTKRIFVQWASARFGVSFDELKSGAGIVIKIGQGAKPGIGGHLPGSKVTRDISIARKIPEGIDAISPAPHHDIYSIEDLAQRIEALKIMSGKPVYVKVAATNYIPYIVTGIARSGAAGVIIDGHGAGTGAAPVTVRDSLGIPVEMAVASSHNILTREGLRENFSIIAAGRVADSTDAMKLYALGADVVSLGTSALLAMGCVMVRKCNLGYCPAALTNRADNKTLMDIDFGIQHTVNFVNGFKTEVAQMMSALGIKNMKELVGNKSLLHGEGLSRNTLKVLGIDSASSINLNFKQGTFNPDKKYINELIVKGEPVISSMGSNAPPDVALPSRIIDWLRLDGAQVTRPSIDPYREDINLNFCLCGGSINISMPVIIKVSDADMEIKNALSWAAMFTGTMVIDDDPGKEFRSIAMTGSSIYKYKKHSYSTGRTLNYTMDGFVIRDDSDMEINIASLDQELKSKGVRENYDILGEIDYFRNTGDIVKYLALGCDSIIISYRIFQEGLNNSSSNIREKAVNFLIGIKKEIALISGAMGIANLQYSIVGNTELLRAINLDNNVARKINVAEAGST